MNLKQRLEKLERLYNTSGRRIVIIDGELPEPPEPNVIYIRVMDDDEVRRRVEKLASDELDSVT